MSTSYARAPLKVKAAVNTIYVLAGFGFGTLVAKIGHVVA